MSTKKFLFLLLFLCSCSSDAFIVHNGNMPSNERISRVKVGDSKSFVEQALGSPSSIVALDTNTWIYMSSDIKKVAFFKPEELSRDVLTIRFNENGMVNSIDRNGLEAGKQIEISAEKTEALGDKPGMLQKTFGTLGTFRPM